MACILGAGKVSGDEIGCVRMLGVWVEIEVVSILMDMTR